MTIVVAIKCTDGAVIACDSMLTVNGFVQNTGQKLHVLQGPPSQLFCFAGDLALALRFSAEATAACGQIPRLPVQGYALHVANATAQNFVKTGVDVLKAQVEAVLGFVKDDTAQICHFICGTQHRALDANHFHVEIGSGSTASTPFMKFLIDLLLGGNQPTVAEGRLLAVWAVNYAIQTMSGGVGGPVDVATIEKNDQNQWAIRELDRAEIQETEEAIAAMNHALKQAKDDMQDEDPDTNVPLPPTGS